MSRSSWSNWCGPSLVDGTYLDSVRCQQLLDALMRVTETNLSPTGTNQDDKNHDGPPPYVFQILDHKGQAIVSFPSAGPYDRTEYATLARDVVARPRGAPDAKTSCTKRYRDKHPLFVPFLFDPKATSC